jgi:hypothetical protein
LEAVANVCEFPGRQVDALLLHFRALLLAVNALLLTVGASLQRFELGRHLLHGVSKFGQLSGDARYVLGSCDSAAILRPESRRAKPTESSETRTVYVLRVEELPYYATDPGFQACSTPRSRT